MQRNGEDEGPKARFLSLTYPTTSWRAPFLSRMRERTKLMPLISNQRVNLHTLATQLVGTAQIRQVDHEGGGQDFAT